MPNQSAEVAWRQHLAVLVMDSHAMGSIAVIRSLGRAGYPVHACASRPDALGFHSHFTQSTALCPEYQDEQFLPWLRRYLADHNIRCIIPSESFLLSIRPAFDEFAALLPYSHNKGTVYSGLSKYDLFATLGNHNHTAPASSDHLPPFLLIDAADALPETEAFQALGPPLFVKVDGAYAINGEDGATLKVETADEAKILVEQLRARFSKVLVQGFVPGIGVGAFVLLWHGTVLARFMHMRLHEVPHTGGVSSYRKAWWHEAIIDDALTSLQKMNWHGVAMMEYRWNARDDRFFLMEMNGRFWGSLHLALYAGVDFPLLLVDSFHCRPSPILIENRSSLGCRNTFPFEVQYVWSRLRDPQLRRRARLWSVIEFFALALDPGVKSDLWFPGDRKIYWRRLLRFLATFL